MFQSLENRIQIIVNLQTTRNLNKAKQDILQVPKTLKGKMKVTETANKIMMKYLMGVRKQRFRGIALSAFCYQNFKLTCMVGEQ
jgi:hypothetical protein